MNSVSSSGDPHAAADALRDPRFRAYLLGRLSSQLITRMQAVVVGWHIYEISGDPVALGYVGLAMFIPMVLFGLIIGDWADRVSRSFLLTVSSLILTGASAAFLGLSGAGVAQVWPYLAATALFGVGAAFNRVAVPALLPQILPPERLSAGIAWASSMGQFALIAGPAVAGLLLLLGQQVAYGAITAVSLFAALIWWRMQVPAALPGPAGGGISTLERVIEGIRFVWRKPLLLGAIALDLFAVLLGGVVALLPVYAKDILHVGPAGLGMLRAAPALGAVLMALALARRPLQRRAGPLFLVAVAVHGLGTLVFGLSENLLLSCGALAIAGAADMVSVVVRTTVVQLATPDAMQGRVNAVNQVVVSASNELGDFRAGVMGGLIGVVPAVVTGCLAILGVTALGAWLWPPLRRLDRMEDAQADAAATTGTAKG
ncbi:MFS transporter [Aquabacter spiritensis]|uniref:Putative MFS family arabinose efflux permease n=1 Tax=Aquabacter spiritensis TaxID=933073 RepID=A0A4R3M399_9HYPH|nr:MFS transporter [Aquabacter spiritensis]TCT05635.1 putative MFS family arabinose efflux permease [Aquabacter spiritensis]